MKKKTDRQIMKSLLCLLMAFVLFANRSGSAWALDTEATDTAETTDTIVVVDNQQNGEEASDPDTAVSTEEPSAQTETPVTEAPAAETPAAEAPAAAETPLPAVPEASEESQPYDAIETDTSVPAGEPAPAVESGTETATEAAAPDADPEAAVEPTTEPGPTPAPTPAPTETPATEKPAVKQLQAPPKRGSMTERIGLIVCAVLIVVIFTWMIVGKGRYRR